MIFKRVIFELLRFAIIGLLAATTHFCIAFMLIDIVLIHPLLANGVAYSIAVFVSYFGHKFFTFRKSNRHSIGKFIIISLSGFGISQFGFYALYSFFKIQYSLALLIIIIVVPSLTFLFSKFWVFK